MVTLFSSSLIRPADISLCGSKLCGSFGAVASFLLSDLSGYVLLNSSGQTCFCSSFLQHLDRIRYGVLCLLEHDEEYVFTLPCAYARSILTVPWVELGGKVSINCVKSGYSATVTFHTKPFYGGKVHR
uniref:Uncharacterized protein n=1 Tax=Acanthochromis polyacanthus TaxID=80966 RepID=A0A3Q1HS65_9TELE